MAAKMKGAWVYLFISLALGMSARLAAMPPHPDIIDSLRQRGDTVGLAKLSARIQAQARRSMQRITRPTDTVQGDYNVLVLLIDYTNRAFDSISTPSFYSNLLNGASPAAMSMNKYYRDMSDDRLKLSIKVYGPYHATNGLAYYGKHNDSGNDSYPATLVREAVLAAQTAGVSFAPYDNNNDGKVDVVMVIHAGAGEEASGVANDIWSHNWDLDSGQYYHDGGGHVSVDGKIVNGYCIQPEFTKAVGDSTIGVFCHEFAHSLGLPDLYDTTEVTYGAGIFTIMAKGAWAGPNNNGSHPTPFLAWEKHFLGWLTFRSPAGSLASLDTVMPSVLNAFADIPESLHNADQPIAARIAFFAGLLASGGLIWYTRRARVAVVILAFVFLLGAMVLGVNCGGTPAADPGVAVSSAAADSSSVASSSSVSAHSVSIEDIESAREAIKIPLGDPAGKQYYLIENKVRKNGTWTQYLPGDGLLITHIHDAVIDAMYTVNTVNDGNRRIHGVNVIEADGGGHLWTRSNTGRATDLFSNRNFDPTTTPRTFYYTGTAAAWSTEGTVASKVYISNISASGSTMTFGYSVR